MIIDGIIMFRFITLGLHYNHWDLPIKISNRPPTHLGNPAMSLHPR